MPICVYMNSYVGGGAINICMKLDLKNHPTLPTLVHKVETESPGALLSVGEEKQLRRASRGRKRFLPSENFTQDSVKNSNCCSLAVSFTCSSYQSNVPFVVKCTTQSWKTLAVYQTSMKQKFKALAWQ